MLVISEVLQCFRSSYGPVNWHWYCNMSLENAERL